MNYTDTIAAISTPHGKGGVALIRISGDEALSVAQKIFSAKLSQVEANTAVYGKIYMIQPNGEKCQIDDGIATVYRAPRSFTGEDTVEICCHGGVLITQTVLTACFAAGARQAEAGEFTRRAFVNGKLGLDSAEALGALLDAGTEAQMKLARSGMSGTLSRKTDELYESLIEIVSEMRADIDFPDEDVSQMTPYELRERLVTVKDEVTRLAATYSTGRAVREGITTVICGATNAGKSSIYNKMVGYDAAIVTDIEGTTRDVLTDTVSFGGVTLKLSDTAGLRSSDDPVEKIGIERSYSAIDTAELILAVFDGSKDPGGEERELVERIKSSKAYTVGVVNKADLEMSKKAYDLAERLDAVVTVSAKSGEGLDRLAETVSSAFLDGSIDISRDAVVATARQYAALTTAAEALGAALDTLDSGMPTDFVCSDAEVAVTRLAEVGGREAAEDIVGNIFSRFCVGK